MNERLGTQALENASRTARDKGILHGLVIASGTRDSLDVLWAWGDAAVSPVARPMTTDAIFDIASVTKAVATTSACAICIDRGLLDPDAPARDYLPALPQFGPDPIRVRDLATHTSGLDNRKFDSEDPESLVAAAIAAPAQWPPATRFEYSCRNFILLGAIAEQAAGEPLADLLQKDLFGPLEMDDTCFGPLQPPSPRVAPTVVAPGIVSDEQARRASRPIGNAGLFSTAPDLARFCRAVLAAALAGETTVFGKTGLAWITEPRNQPGLPRWSFGWDMRPYPNSPPPSLAAVRVGHRPFGLDGAVRVDRPRAQPVSGNPHEPDPRNRHRGQLRPLPSLSVRAGRHGPRRVGIDTMPKGVHDMIVDNSCCVLPELFESVGLDNASQRDDGVCAVEGPEHAGVLQALGHEGAAAGFDDA